MTIEGAIAELQNLIKADDVPFYYNGAIQKVIETIIDKRLVRCGECKWCEKSGGVLWCNIWHNDTNGLNFCSYAERRADENN